MRWTDEAEFIGRPEQVWSLAYKVLKQNSTEMFKKVLVEHYIDQFQKLAYFVSQIKVDS